MNVIVPDPSLKDNQVDLGYSCFYVMFKLKIIHYLMKIHDISLAQANSIWEEGYSFDQRIYEIMKMIIEIEKPSVVINRNPTLRNNWCCKTPLTAGSYQYIINTEINRNIYL